MACSTPTPCRSSPCPRKRCCPSSSARRHLGEQVTVKTIVDSFQTKPYGWDLPSIEVLIAFLVGSSKVTLTVDGNVLKRSEVATTLRNTQKHPHTVVARQKTFDERKVAAFRKFCTDFFDEASTPKDPLELARHGADKLKGKRDELKATAAGSKYPFVAQLATPIDLLDQAVGKPDDWYLTDFDLGDDLLDAKENLIDPIQAFLNGPQRVIYDEAAALLTTHSSNLGYLPAGSDETVRNALADPNAFRGNRMAQLKQATDELRAQIDAMVATNANRRHRRHRGPQGRAASRAPTTPKATPEAQQSVLAADRRTRSRASVQREPESRSSARLGPSFEVTASTRQLLDQLAASPAEAAVTSDAPAPASQARRFRSRPSPCSGVPGVLETEEDVDQYLAALRDALVQTLNDGKRISL